MFKINDKSTRTRQEICSKVFWKVVVYLASFWCLAFTVSFEHITHLALFIAFFLLALNIHLLSLRFSYHEEMLAPPKQIIEKYLNPR